MTRVTLELDDETLARVEYLARAKQTSVENLLRDKAQEIARLAPIELDNPSHRKILSALDRGPDFYQSPRDEVHDRGQGARDNLRGKSAAIARFDR